MFIFLVLKKEDRLRGLFVSNPLFGTRKPAKITLEDLPVVGHKEQADVFKRTHEQNGERCKQAEFELREAVLYAGTLEMEIKQARHALEIDKRDLDITTSKIHIGKFFVNKDDGREARIRRLLENIPKLEAEYQKAELEVQAKQQQRKEAVDKMMDYGDVMHKAVQERLKEKFNGKS